MYELELILNDQLEEHESKSIVGFIYMSVGLLEVPSSFVETGD